MVKRPEGFGKGSRGNKILCQSKDVRIGDGSVLPAAHVRSQSYRDVAAASGSGASGSGSGLTGLRRGLPQVNLPGQAGPGPPGPIKTSVEDIKLNPNHSIHAGDNAWPLGRVAEAPKRIATYPAMVVMTGDITSMDLMDTSVWLYSFSSLR